MKDLEEDAARLLGDKRTEIDRIDRKLVELLAERKKLVREVAEVKIEHGLPIYLPGREDALIRERRKEAGTAGVSPDLVEDLLRRIIRESYQAEGTAGFKATVDPVPIVLVGGRGGIGKLFHRMFTNSGFTVRILEKDNWDQAEMLLRGAGLVMVGVPIALTLEVIDRLAGKLERHCILADVTSIKTAPLAKMMEIHQGPVLGLHPMFGPDTHILAKQVIVYCPGRDPEAYNWLLQQFRIWGILLLEADPREHDHMMGIIQAMRHFETFVYGVHLYEENADLEKILTFSSPIYRLELGMIGRLFAQDPNLYADIIFSSQEGKAIIKRYLKRFSKLRTLLDKEDKAGFTELFHRTAQWFGSFADQFLEESSRLIEKADEHKRPKQS